MNQVALCFLLSTPMTLVAHAGVVQDYPAKPIRLLVPFAPGGSSDIQARIIGQKLTEAWGQPVIIDNRAGAGGIVAAQLGAHSMPDGYTLFMGHIGTQSANPALYRNLPYDPERDFAPVIMTIRQPLILVVPPQLKVSTVPELIALARSQRAALNCASAGNGSPNHLAAEMFKVMGGVNVTHVPYKGAAPAEIDVMAGRVALFFDTMLSAIPFVKDGRLKALAVTSAARSTSMPALPTVAESGVKGYEFWTWNGFFVPAGTPAAIIADLNREIANILNTAEVQRRLTTDGAEIAAGSPQALAAYAKGERAKLARVISAAGIRIE